MPITSSVDLEQTLREFIDTLDIQNKKDVEEYCVGIFKKVK